MARYLLTDLPQRIPATEYGSAVDELTQRIARAPGFVSLYSIGGVSSPGISDLDLVAVWEDGAVVEEDFRPLASPLGPYLFIHSLYGTSRSLFLEAQAYTCYSPYRLLAGKDLLAGGKVTTPETEVRNQIAREYLLRLFVGLYLQRLHRLVRVRSVLLNANGIAADVAYLTPGDAEAAHRLEELRGLRQAWFVKDQPPQADFVHWFDDFIGWLTGYFTARAAQGGFHLPADRVYSLGRNIRLLKSDRPEFPSSAIRLPFLQPLVGRKYPNLLNRINRHVFRIPYDSSGTPESVRSYFDFTERHRAYNRIHLPRHLSLTGSLQLS